MVIAPVTGRCHRGPCPSPTLNGPCHVNDCHHSGGRDAHRGGCAVTPALLVSRNSSPYTAGRAVGSTPPVEQGMAEDEILTLREVADYLKLTERTLYRLTQEVPRSSPAASAAGLHLAAAHGGPFPHDPRPGAQNRCAAGRAHRGERRAGIRSFRSAAAASPLRPLAGPGRLPGSGVDPGAHRPGHSRPRAERLWARARSPETLDEDHIRDLTRGFRPGAELEALQALCFLTRPKNGATS